MNTDINYLKYLKYKGKYLSLYNKIQNGGILSDSEIKYVDLVKGKSLLQKIYTDVKRDTTPLHDKYPLHQITYGEMNYDGIEHFLTLLNSENKLTYVMDIGSGRGKICIYVALHPDIKQSIGVEIVKERHDDAIALLEQFKKEIPIENVNLINDDILRLNLKVLVPAPALIWWSNLCFSQELIDKITLKLVDELPKGSIIVCSKDLTANPKIEKMDKKVIPMSWNATHEVFVNRII
jgi:hypothetical protein